MNPDGNDDKFPTLPSGARDTVWGHDHVATWKDMEALPGTGKTRAIGVCNYSVPYMKNLLAQATIVPAVNQIENHPRLPQQDVVDFCQSKGIHVMAYSPLGSAGGPLLQDKVVLDLAKEKDVDASSILLSYAGKLNNGSLSTPFAELPSMRMTNNTTFFLVARGNTVLAKSVKPERITSNLKIVDLSNEDLQLIANGLNDGSLERYVYPPFGVNLGFPDKTDGKRMINGA